MAPNKIEIKVYNTTSVTVYATIDSKKPEIYFGFGGWNRNDLYHTSKFARIKGTSTHVEGIYCELLTPNIDNADTWIAILYIGDDQYKICLNPAYGLAFASGVWPGADSIPFTDFLRNISEPR